MEIKTKYKILDTETNLWHLQGNKQGKDPYFWNDEKRVKDHIKVVISDSNRINIDPYKTNLYQAKLDKMKIVEEMIITHEGEQSVSITEFFYDLSPTQILVRRR